MKTSALSLLLTACLVAACTSEAPTLAPPAPTAPPTADAGRSLPDAPPAQVFTFAQPELLARRLASMLWNQEADQPLIDRLRAAPIDGDRLAQIAAEMMTDARGRKGLRDFFHWWLFLEPLETLVKEDPEGLLDRDLRLAMMEEAPALGVYLMLDTGGSFTDLLTAPITFVNERLARHYQMTGVTGSHFRAVPYPPDQHRIGLLSGAGLLALFSSLNNPSWPAKRSWLINDPLLCTLPIRTFQPPPVLDRNRSIRHQMIDMTKAEGCMGCHAILNSPGFAFIGFDSFGRWRPEPGHGPGETEGWIPAAIMPDEPRFDGPEGLARLLVSRDEAPRCFTRTWLRYAVDRRGSLASDRSPTWERSLDAAFHDFARSGFQLRQVPLAIVRTASFAGAP